MQAFRHAHKRHMHAFTHTHAHAHPCMQTFVHTLPPDSPWHTQVQHTVHIFPESSLLKPAETSSISTVCKVSGLSQLIVWPTEKHYKTVGCDKSAAVGGKFSWRKIPPTNPLRYHQVSKLPLSELTLSCGPYVGKVQLLLTSSCSVDILVEPSIESNTCCFKE